MSRMQIVVIVISLGALGCGGSQGTSEGRGELPAHGHGHPGAEHSEHGHHGHGRGGHAGHDGHAHGHDFADADRWAALFDDPGRDAWQRPTEVVQLLQLSEGMVVADLGAGTGYFLSHLSAPVGAQGRVVGLDVEPNMVEYMRRRIAQEQLSNSEAGVVPMDSPGLEAASTDRVLIVNTWHHIADRETYARRLREALRPGGFVLVVDFTMESAHGPPPEMRLAPEVVTAELEAGGLSAQIVEESLPMQYVVRGSLP